MLDYYKETTTRNNEGRYIVRIPFIEGNVELGESRMVATQRFHQLERRLKRDAIVRAKYNELCANTFN